MLFNDTYRDLLVERVCIVAYANRQFKFYEIYSYWNSIILVEIKGLKLIVLYLIIKMVINGAVFIKNLK